MSTHNNQGRSKAPANHATQSKQFQNKDHLDSREHEKMNSRAKILRTIRRKRKARTSSRGTSSNNSIKAVIFDRLPPLL